MAVAHVNGHDAFEAIRTEAEDCRRCGLWERATQTVFGEGPVPAQIMLVGEQPGDREDEIGLPFVGPAGRLLDRALAGAGLDRDEIFVTNVVKHFKWTPRGKRRIHHKPDAAEVRACRPWLTGEIALVRPAALVCLGATAAQSLLGRDFRVTAQRGQPVVSPLAPLVVATVHPSSLLRLPEDANRARELARFTGDLRTVAEFLAAASEPRRQGAGSG